MTTTKAILHTLDARDQLLDHVALRTRALLQHLDLPLGNPKLLGNQAVILTTTIDSTVQSFQVLVDTTEAGLDPLIHGVHIQSHIGQITVHLCESLRLLVDDAIL